MAATAVAPASHMPLRTRILWALLVALGAAAILGLVVLFIGGQDQVLKLLLSVLVFAAVLALALPSQLHAPAIVRGLMATLCVADGIIVWVLVWGAEQSSVADALGRAAGMITVLLVVANVALMIWQMVRGPRLRPARIAMWVSHVTGLGLLAIAWEMILTDADPAPPARVTGGIAIIYVAASLGAILIALMRRYKVVPRDSQWPG